MALVFLTREGEVNHRACGPESGPGARVGMVNSVDGPQRLESAGVRHDPLVRPAGYARALRTLHESPDEVGLALTEDCRSRPVMSKATQPAPSAYSGHRPLRSVHMRG